MHVRAAHVRRAGWALLAAALLGGCVTAPQVPAGESVVVAVTLGPDTASPVKIRNESVGGHSVEGLVGGGAGAVAGGVWGLACGPLAGLCVPLGAMLGADIGVVAGLAVGTTAALPEDKAVLLTDRVRPVLQSRDVRRALEEGVIERAQGLWKLDSTQPTWAVDIELIELSLASTRDERVRWVVKVLVDARAAGVAAAPRPKRRAYERAGPYGSLSDWLDQGNDFAGTSLYSVCGDVASQIVSDLSAKPAPGAARE